MREWWTPHVLFGAPIEAAGIGYLLGRLTLDRIASASPRAGTSNLESGAA